VCSSASPSASASRRRGAGHTSIAFVYQLCAFLPAIGLLAVFLPKMPKAVR
jgi:hypothetical protein